MIGNDIVDIAEAKNKSNWQRPRFLEKLFSLEEQECIYNADDPTLMVWSFWSMKEAAYKLYIQLEPSRFYNPKSFECKLDNLLGTVIFQDFKCFVHTKITSNYLISEARLEQHKMTSKVLKLENENSNAISKILKTELLKSAAKRFEAQATTLQVIKDEFGVPAIKFGLKKLNVSLTHHGNYGAYAIF